MRGFGIESTALHLVVMLSALIAAPTRSVEAQLGDRVMRAAKQKVEERKERTKENVVQRATEPVDSTLERIAAPVDSVVGRAAGGAAVAVSRVGRSRAAEIEAEARRLSEELSTAGRAEVAGIVFAPGMDQAEPGSEIYLSALARALSGMQGAFLIEGRAGMDEDGAGGRELGGRRAAAVKTSLVAQDLMNTQVFDVGRTVEDGPAVPITVVRMQ